MRSPEQRAYCSQGQLAIKYKLNISEIPMTGQLLLETQGRRDTQLAGLFCVCGCTHHRLDHDRIRHMLSHFAAMFPKPREVY